MNLSRPLLCLLLVAACTRADPRALDGDGERALKPSAPVHVVLVATPRGGDQYDVTLSARPVAGQRAMLLQVLVPDGAVAESGVTQKLFSAASAGDLLSLRLRLRLPDGGVDLFGSARVPSPSGRGLTRSRVVHVRVGRAPVSRAGVPGTVVLPSGDRVAEVRP